LIASPSLKYRIDNKKKYKKLKLQYQIYENPARTDTDWFLLDLSLKITSDILSNDTFKDYWKEFGKESILSKRKPFMILEKVISIKID
jgi:hypothetical protein